MRIADPTADSPAAAADTPTAATDIDAATIRAAMLGVYYESLGRQFQISGAPSVMLPLQARPQPLAESLEQLSGSPSRMLAALWLLIRGVRGGRASARDYPAELLAYVEPGSLTELVRLRRDYRAGANLFAAALVACRDGYWDQFLALAALLEEPPAGADLGFSQATSILMGVTAAEYLRSAALEGNRETTSNQIQRLESEVGINIYDFVEQLADAAAFSEYARHHIPAAATDGSEDLLVFPVSSVIRQDRNTLTTTATATALVTGRADTLGIASDPRAWAWSSDVIQQAHYVDDAYALAPKGPETSRLGRGFEGYRLLDEVAMFAWGRRSDERSVFHNVLNIAHRVRHFGQEQQSIDIRFSLSRSIASSVLWDRRSGGLQLNSGYLKVRPLGHNTFRVTTRKMLRFSDRTPYASSQGSLDFGQMLNYLAPAALTWWVESETYSMSDPAYARTTTGSSRPAPGEEREAP